MSAAVYCPPPLPTTLPAFPVIQQASYVDLNHRVVTVTTVIISKPIQIQGITIRIIVETVIWRQCQRSNNQFTDEYLRGGSFGRSEHESDTNGDHKMQPHQMQGSNDMIIECIVYLNLILCGH
eukprot:774494_1